AVAVCSAASAGGRRMAQASSATAATTRRRPWVDSCCRWLDTPLITFEDLSTCASPFANIAPLRLRERSGCTRRVSRKGAKAQRNNRVAHSRNLLPRGAGGLRVGLAGQLPDQIDLFGAVRRAVLLEDFVKPDGRFPVDIRPLPRIPRQKGLRLACDEAPVDGRDFIFFGDGQRPLKGALIAARHVFGAKDRAVESLQPLDALLEFGGVVVIVKRDHVRVFELNPFHRR